MTVTAKVLEQQRASPWTQLLQQVWHGMLDWQLEITGRNLLHPSRLGAD